MVSVRIKVDESLRDLLTRVQLEIAEDMKQKYNIKDVTIHGTLASQIIAARHYGKKVLNFKIRKTGLNCGVLELI